MKIPATSSKIQIIRQVHRLKAITSAVENFNSAHWLEATYGRWLHGGWKHEDGRVIKKKHLKAIRFHEACKQRFCPKCWSSIGFIGENKEEVLHCDRCDKDYKLYGEQNDRAGKYELLFISGGNQSSKSVTMMSEFCAQLEGKRPWDGSLTCLDKEPGDWLLAAPSFTEHFPKTIWPYFKQRMGHKIKRIVRDASGAEKCFILEDGNKVFCSSYEQAMRAGTQVAGPFESARYKGAGLDEPPPRRVLPAIMRGMMVWQSRGEGRVIIAGTSVHDEYLFNTVYNKSHNLGGSTRTFFSIEFEASDNPSLSKEQLDNLRATCSTPEEVQMRLHGKFKSLSGRVYPEFDEEFHVFDSFKYNPLLKASSQGKAPSEWTDQDASDLPIICCVDPHDKRPWVITWWAITPFDGYLGVAEWPSGVHYADLRGHSDAGTDGSPAGYASLIEEVEATFPGGQARVWHRYMDPLFGPQTKLGLEGQTVQETMALNYGLYFDTEIDARLLDTRHAQVRNLLRHDKTQPMSILNMPYIRVGSNMKNTIWSFNSYTNKPDVNPESELKTGVKDIGKDHMDTIGWIATKRPLFCSTRLNKNRASEHEDALLWRTSGLGAD